MGLLERGREALIRRQQQAAAPSGAVVYHRASDGLTCDLTGLAWVGRTAFRVADSPAGTRLGEEQQGGSRVQWSDRDYLVPAADLVISGVPIVPAAGDWFEEVLPAPEGTQRFEVLPFNGEPEARYSDPQRTVWRVHTKRVQPG